jgi:hypothetical protein
VEKPEGGTKPVCTGWNSCTFNLPKGENMENLEPEVLLALESIKEEITIEELIEEINRMER